MAGQPKVAIACQGGGSHAAYAAGILLGLLATPTRDRFEIVALSGTSGGAMCAALAWAGLVGHGSAEASARLEHFWRDLEARDFFDALVNAWGVWVSELPIIPEVSPYSYEPVAESALRALLARHLRLEELSARERGKDPLLFIGATDVQTGDRVIFHGRELTYDDLVASAAVPPLYRAVKADGRLCWDGLFTTNPPVREFTDLADRPDEIWVVQINPQRRREVPRTMREIIDRRNELSGNLSLGQELYFIDRINRLLRTHPSLVRQYKPIVIRVVELSMDNLDYPSKLDRSAALIEHLLEAGKRHAARFFEPASLWPREGSLPAKAVLVRAPV